MVVDSTVIMRMVDRKKKDFTDYENSKKDYDKNLEKYDDEIMTEKEREKDFFKSSFEPKTKISQMPNRPSQPSDYDGPLLDLYKGLGKGNTAAIEWSDANKDKIGRSAYLKNTVGAKSNKPDASFATRMGYLLSSLDNTKTGKISYVGHVFGKLGQAQATDP